MNVINTTGKRAVATMGILLAIFMIASLFNVQSGGHVVSVQATSTATTTVTVLNTPPSWDVLAYELFESSIASPTNAGTSTWWTASASDSNGEDWYLLVCKSSSTPTAAVGAPTCGGGSTDQWIVSGPVASGGTAIVSTTTQDAWAESNAWFAYICDGNLGSPRCNESMWNGDGSATSSPFIVNHRPTITLAADDSPTLPGETVTWTTTASDGDSVGGADQVQLFVCKLADFDETIPGCATEGWATSTLSANNPSTSTDIAIPTQDGDLGAYVYVVDQHGFPAVSAWHGSSTILTVDNAAPYVASSTITLFDVFGSTTPDTTLALTEPEGETQNFVVTFDVTDNNGCLNTLASNEITDVDINVFRSGKGGVIGAGCDSAGEYNANDCYTHTHTQWVPTCYQDPADTCTANTLSVTWECTFPLWYIADPTDVGSVYVAEDWRASARATDDDAATGNYSTDDEGAGLASEMTQFLSFRATGTPIAYGSFEPGFGNPNHPATTTVYATGNTGLNHYLSGDAMCVTYPTCTGYSTSTIYVPYQHYATTSSSITWQASPDGVTTFALSTSSAPVLVDVDITKTTSTSSPKNDDTYWGIFVPSSITFAGDYIGRNYIDAVLAPSSEW